jgi:hypothetical protein
MASRSLKRTTSVPTDFPWIRQNRKLLEPVLVAVRRHIGEVVVVGATVGVVRVK